MITDSSGASVAHYEYDAFGNLLASSSDISFGFNYRYVGSYGVRWDATLGMYYMRQRWFDPAGQRFVSRDPIGMGGGVNLYAYCENSPTDRVDPRGTDDVSQILRDVRAYDQEREPARIRYRRRRKKVIERLRCLGFNSEADIIEYYMTYSPPDWLGTPDKHYGGTNPFTLTIYVNDQLDDALFLATAVHESIHVEQGRLRVTLEGLGAKGFGNPNAEAAQEYEAYRGEAAFIDEYLRRARLPNTCCQLTDQERQELTDRRNYAEGHARSLLR